MAASAASVVRSTVEVLAAPRLEGELRLPGDKSISHRALMLALLARGESRIRGAGDGADVRSSAGLVAALGATVDVERSVAAPANRLVINGSEAVTYRVSSPGIDHLREPAGTLDCGNSGTTLRLFAGILAGQPMRA